MGAVASVVNVRDQRLARIETELAGVGLDLREIRIDGAVHGQVRRNPPAQVHAELGPRGVVAPSGGVGAAVEFRGGYRIQIEDEPAAQVGEVLEPSGLREKRRGIAPGRRPAVLDALLRGDAGDVNAPVLLRLRLITQALERDPHLDVVTTLGEAALRLKDEVLAEIRRLAAARRHGAARAFGKGAIELDAERVDAKHQRLARVVIGAEEDDDVIVGLDAIAIGKRGANGGLRPRGFVQVAVDINGLIDPWRLDVE